MKALDFLFLAPYKNKIEKALHETINSMGPVSTLRDAVEYALTGEAKRLRPLIVLFIAESLGSVDVMDAALSVEFFHTASLIADDLPCMDNDDFRRNKPSLHKAFSEDIALLASYTLIAQGYERIGMASLQLGSSGPFICQKALQFVSARAGILGATNGQFLDLHPTGKDLETLNTIIYQKTVTLFEISFALGFLFGKGSTEKFSIVIEAANHLGFAFQIADDLQDFSEDETSLVTILGKEKALTLYNQHRKDFDEKIVLAGIEHKGLKKLVSLMDALAGI
jgi:geranylgeranyl diphosphate synthase, type II